MSIDARIVGISYLHDGRVRLNLESRDDRTAPAGQPVLFVDNAPSPFPLVVGDEIWGDSSCIMRRDTRIARRVGYQEIVFIELAKKAEAPE